MVLAESSYPLLNAIWTIIVFFAWLIWLWLLITIFADLFRRADISGWGKAGWVIVLLVLPFIGVLIYLIAEGRKMAERRDRQARVAQSDFDSYVRSVSAAGQPADQIARGKKLLDDGAITPQEYEAIKQKALT